MTQSKHPLRIVLLTRSQMEFALGLLGVLFKTRSPNRHIDSSIPAEKIICVALIAMRLMRRMAKLRMSDINDPRRHRRRRATQAPCEKNYFATQRISAH